MGSPAGHHPRAGWAGGRMLPSKLSMASIQNRYLWMAVNGHTVRWIGRKHPSRPTNKATQSCWGSATRARGELMATATGASTASTSSKTRWIQLVLGIVCMSMLANLQYGWTMFVHPMAERHGWSIAAIQVAFSIFIITETWPQFALGWVMDRYGPRMSVCIGGPLIGAFLVLNSFADSLGMLYFAQVVGGIGVCAVAASTFGNAFKWFPDKRGLAIGLTSAGFGAGAALTVVPIQYMIEAGSYEEAFFTFGL